MNHYKIDHTDINKVFIINLDRSKDRKQRYERILSAFGKKFFNQDIQTLRFRGTDGLNDLVFIDKKTKQKLSKNDFNQRISGEYIIFDKKDQEVKITYKAQEKYKLTIQELGCLLSHLRCINEIIKNNYDYTIIMEDDFKFLVDVKKYYKLLDEELKYTPRHFEIIKLNKTTWTPLQKVFSWFRSSLISGYNKYHINLAYSRNEYRAECYLISIEGAKRIMKFIREYTFTGFDSADDFLFKTLTKNYNFNNSYQTVQNLITQEKKNKIIN